MKCNAKSLLKENNLKATKQRVLILQEVLDNKEVFTANTLFTIFNKDMDLVTIYRIISAFLEKGIIREVLGHDDIKRYEVACIHNPVHPHLYCKKCNKLVCLKSLDKEIVKLLMLNTGNYIIDDVSIQFTGICEQCNL